MLNKIIKEETQSLHSNLEKLMHVEEIMNGELTYLKYQDMMVTNYIITAKYQQQLLSALTPETALKLEIHKRVKVNALQKDLAEIKVYPEDLEKQEFNLDPNFALGCLYVLEGASLGGNIIVNKLKHNEQLKPYRLNFNYYQVYGDNLIANWKQFCEVVNEQPQHNHQKIIDGAKYMYAQFTEMKLSK